MLLNTLLWSNHILVKKFLKHKYVKIVKFGGSIKNLLIYLLNITKSNLSVMVESEAAREGLGQTPSEPEFQE